MSIITVQLGQCGNQMGFHFFDHLAEAIDASNKTYKDASSKARETFVSALRDRFFHERLPPLPSLGVKLAPSSTSLHARAVLVDMETKVVGSVVEAAERRNGKWKYHADRIYSQKQGSGNNWGNGYLNYGAECKEGIVDKVRKELESCDHFEGFLLLMSLAGGTGSGLGTATATLLQDSFGGLSGRTSVCQAVWPHSSGEVILQNYNTLLSIAHLHQVSDAVILHFNDILHHICKKRLNLPEVTFADMNRLIAHHLSSVLAPAWPLDLRPIQPVSKPSNFLPHPPPDDASKTAYQHLPPPKTPSLPQLSSARTKEECCNWNEQKTGNFLTDLVSQLAPHPAYRLLQSYSVPIMSPNCLDFSRDHWSSLLKRLRQMLLTNIAVDEGLDWHMDTTTNKLNRSLANILYLRGIDLDLSHCRLEMERTGGGSIASGIGNTSKHFDFGLLEDKQIYAPWVPSNDHFNAYASPFCHGGYEKSATLLSNSSAIWRPLDMMVQKSWKMFSSKAYIHQYETFGLTQDDFLDSFASVEQIINNYKDL